MKKSICILSFIASLLSGCNSGTNGNSKSFNSIATLNDKVNLAQIHPSFKSQAYFNKIKSINDNYKSPKGFSYIDLLSKNLNIMVTYLDSNNQFQ